MKFQIQVQNNFIFIAAYTVIRPTTMGLIPLWSYLSDYSMDYPSIANILTHWGRVTHICVGKPIIIGSDNGLSPDRRQAIICTNAGKLSIGPLRTYFSENLIKIQQFSLKKMRVKMSSAKWRPSCLGLNVLNCKHFNFFRKTWFVTTRAPKQIMLLC